MALLKVGGLTKHFGGLAAVANVDMTVEKGEILGVIGPNGAGKTTLFNLISGSIGPSSGSIEFKDASIAGLKPHQICKRGLARTFQSVKVFPNMTVRENVLVSALFGMSHNPSTAEANKRAMATLEFVGLADRIASLAGDLSVANQKRVELARALATKPELLLLDEVIAGLNPAEVSQFIELIRKVCDQGVTIVMIEHVMQVIMQLSHRIMVLHHGEKIAEGSPEEIARSQKVIEVYLGKQ